MLVWLISEKSECEKKENPFCRHIRKYVSKDIYALIICNEAYNYLINIGV